MLDEVTLSSFFFFEGEKSQQSKGERLGKDIPSSHPILLPLVSSSSWPVSYAGRCSAWGWHSTGRTLHPCWQTPSPGRHGYRTVFFLCGAEGSRKQTEDSPKFKVRTTPHCSPSLIIFPPSFLPIIIPFPLLPCFLAVSSLPFPYICILIEWTCNVSPHHRMTLMK